MAKKIVCFKCERVFIHQNNMKVKESKCPHCAGKVVGYTKTTKPIAFRFRHEAR